MRTVVAVLLSCFLIPRPLTSSVIKIEDGGYRDIIVAIHNNVAQDKVLLENLKELLTNTSAFLYNATRGLAYFKDITIVIPENWTSYLNYTTVFSNQFEHAHIRIDLENEYYGPEPFTRHFRDCGEPGEFIQLSPNFLHSLSSPTARNSFGIPERRMVHEWAHFRYGVFDEHPIIGDNNYPAYYRDGNKVVPNTCGKDIGDASYFVTTDGNKCDPTEPSGPPCLLRTFGSSVTASASLMYSTEIPTVTSFCDYSETNRHNRKAITKQNLKCQYKSTWEVISANEDFRQKRQITFPPNTIPNFRIIRQSLSAGRCVLVLDISGSMEGTPIRLLHESASRFLSDQAPDNIKVSIVKFGSNADIVEPLTVINNVTRKSLVSKLPKVADGGGTAIGKGLLESVKALEKDNQSVEGSVILLITDGEETDAPMIEEVLPMLLKKKVVVKTIAYGDKASEKLSNLTSATGGQGFFFKDINDAQASTENLEAAFMEALTLQSDVAFEPVTISRKTIKTLLPETTYKCRVDDGLGKNTIFAITASNISQIAAELLSPTNRTFTENSTEYSSHKNLNRIVFRFQNSEVGQWRLTIKKLGSIPVSVSFAVTSEPKNSQIQPVRIHTYLDSVITRTPPSVKIYAQVTKNRLPVIHAQVLAIVTTPHQKSHKIKLKDNGKAPDSTKKDGLYTGYFTAFDGNGRYSVSAEIIGTKTVRVLRRKRRSPKTPPRNRRSVVSTADHQNVTHQMNEDYQDYEYEDEEIADDLYESEPIGMFERTANAGVFSIDDWNPQTGDIIPPIRVTDLAVINTNVTEEGVRLATIRWTSPGDDEDKGNATFIELRVSTDFDKLLTDFNSTTEINDSFVVDGTMTPQPADEVQILKLKLPMSLFRVDNDDQNATVSNFSNIVYVSMRAGDESGNLGKISNIASLYFEDVLPTSYADDENVGNVEKGGSEGIHPGIVILIVVACGAVMLAGLMLCLSRKRKKSYRPVFVMTN